MVQLYNLKDSCNVIYTLTDSAMICFLFDILEWIWFKTKLNLLRVDVN